MKMTSCLAWAVVLAPPWIHRGCAVSCRVWWECAAAVAVCVASFLRLRRSGERALADEHNVRHNTERPDVLLFTLVALTAQNFWPCVIQTTKYGQYGRINESQTPLTCH